MLRQSLNTSGEYICRIGWAKQQAQRALSALASSDKALWEQTQRGLAPLAAVEELSAQHQAQGAQHQAHGAQHQQHQAGTASPYQAHFASFCQQKAVSVLSSFCQALAPLASYLASALAPVGGFG